MQIGFGHWISPKKVVSDLKALTTGFGGSIKIDDRYIYYRIDYFE